jgi:hemoglobin
MPPSPHDIVSRADIECLVNAFYASVRADELLGPIFDDIARTDWDTHLPKMYDFWSAVLFGAAGFQGDPLGVHKTLARKTPLGEAEFGRWLQLFHATIDSLFDGPVADHAKMRAVRIASVMQYHVGQQEYACPSR